MDSDSQMKKLIDNISSDLNSLSTESKRKYTPVKEASEACLLKLRQINSKPNLHKTLCESSHEIIQPLILGCDTKQPKIIQICLASVQKVIEAKILNTSSATILIETLWSLTDHNLEDLKVLQTIILLVNTTDVVKHHLLAKTLTIGIRLFSSKDPIVMNTANATISQMINRIFERALNENENKQRDNLDKLDMEKLKNLSDEAPSSLNEAAQDAFMMLQDIYLLLDSRPSKWLIGIKDLSRPFGLEILKTILIKYSLLFLLNPEMCFLLKERICTLLIKLFSPSVKLNSHTSSSSTMASIMQQSSHPSIHLDKNYYLTVSRLMRIVFVIIEQYFELLVTESEIFLSVLTKFLDYDRPMWQRALAIEIFHKFSIKPQLIRLLCVNYDMKQPADEKTLAGLFTAISTFIGTLFINNQSKPDPAPVAQPVFVFKDLAISLVAQHIPGQAKAHYLDTWDRNELPSISDAYLLSISYAAVLEFTKSIEYLIENEKKVCEKEPDWKIAESDEAQTLLNSSASSFFSILSLLLDTCADEAVSDSLLRSLESFIYLSALLKKPKQREQFIQLLCKTALPSSYAPLVVNSRIYEPPSPSKNGSYNRSNSMPSQNGAAIDEADKMQVVAIGPPLDSSSPTTTVYLTSKNLLALKFILSMCKKHSELYDSSWLFLLNTMQHLSWILCLKPVAGAHGTLKHASSISTNAMDSAISSNMVTTAMQNEINALSIAMSSVFEKTKDLSEAALSEVINALIRMSFDCINIQNMTKTSEPCLFAIAKLYEATVANMARVSFVWEKVCMHLLEISKHPNLRLRDWCVDSICALVKHAFNYKHEKPLHESHELKQMFLAPLQELSFIEFTDVRQKQLECTLTILRLTGQHLNNSWPLCLSIIGAINKDQTETLIRSAFQCLQLVVTDFLPMMKANYLSLVIQVVSKFGFQEQDLNISLTAIVLLWNISDYMFRNNDSLAAQFTALNETTENTATLETTWMVYYSSLGELCVNMRPAMRKSASQTLFCTIASHGAVLSEKYWQDLVWCVLFPLLEHVKNYAGSASKERDATLNAQNLLMHHSRDTAEKQWAETSVLTLSGVARVFNSKCSTLVKLNDFHKMWTTLLEIIENAAVSKTNEIALAALRGFHELLGNQNYYSSSHSGTSNATASAVAAAAAAAASTTNHMESTVKSETASVLNYLDTSQWLAAWKTWLNIGLSVYVKERGVMQLNFEGGNSANGKIAKNRNSGGLVEDANGTVPSPPPNQTYLTCYFDLMPIVLDVISFKFSKKDFEAYASIMHKMLSVPVLNGDFASFVLIQPDVSLTPLQNSCLNSVRHFVKLFKSSETFEETFLPFIFQRLLAVVMYACSSPQSHHHHHHNSRGSSVTSPASDKVSFMNVKSNEYSVINFVPFGEKALTLMTTLYDEYANHTAVLENQILKQIIQNLYTPLSMKYACPSPTTWKFAIECLLKIMKKALPTVFKTKNNYSYEELWTELAKTFEDFLFTKNIGSSELSIEAIQKDEMIDCQVIELIRDEILAYSSQLPQAFIQRILTILNRGSIYSNSSESFLDMDSSRKLREMFSKKCFETLLKYSFVTDGNTEEVADGTLNNMALASMLNRCKDIMQRYAHDESLNGTVPLPRARTNEMICVLNSLCTLIGSLKKAPKDCVQNSIWNQVIGLYPCLIECTTSPSSQICTAVKEALYNYFSLLKAPSCK